MWTVLRAFVLLLLVLAFSGDAPANTLRTTVRASIEAQGTGPADLGEQQFSLPAQGRIVLANGTGAGQANRIFADRRTLSASATENLDLFGTLTDAYGATLSFVTVKALRICAAAANTNNVNAGGAASNGFVGPFLDATDKIAVKPGGCFLAVAPGTGWTVTDSTGDLLLIANSAGSTSVTYDITVVGTQ